MLSEIPALKIEAVSKNYGALQAVCNLNLRVESGEIFALLGPNAAGKSTTIHMITGLARLSAGHIEVFGHDVVSEATTARRLIGLMHQEIIFDNFFTVDQALKIHAGYYGYPDDPQWRQTLIERLALGPFLNRKPIQLSGGTKRRLMLAKALIHKPKLLILDEPTAGVDVELRHAIWDFVREINRSGTTVLLTTHYLEEAEKMCSRVAILNQGQLVALDTMKHLLEKNAASLEDVFLKLTSLPAETEHENS